VCCTRLDGLLDCVAPGLVGQVAGQTEEFAGRQMPERQTNFNPHQDPSFWFELVVKRQLDGLCV
jgi:hypothetical protein